MNQPQSLFRDKLFWATVTSLAITLAPIIHKVGVENKQLTPHDIEIILGSLMSGVAAVVSRVNMNPVYTPPYLLGPNKEDIIIEDPGQRPVPPPV